MTAERFIHDIQTFRQTHTSISLPAYDGWPESVHCFSTEEQEAILTALSAERPLLICGEPGTGKTQIARAVAVRLGRNFVSKTLNARTEIDDLYWTKDVVRRLADAQVLSATLGGWLASRPPEAEGGDLLARQIEDNPSFKNLSTLLDTRLAESRYVEPGVLWWGFNWANAEAVRNHGLRAPKPRAVWSTESSSAVVLLDEIDKADPVLPQALLEALGTGRFESPISGEYIYPADHAKPLVIITSNGERMLPQAFQRRCVVLRLALPEGHRLSTYLVELGRVHARQWGATQAELTELDEVLVACAERVVEVREATRAEARPGTAEYLDLLRAVYQASADPKQRVKDVQSLSQYVVNKYQTSASVGGYE